ncbi:hypothetical protein CDD83_2014 [Cordyceps sp. RAO-2017]|nr:hypothetical protein CDD83_2014 [Cordyceps sp. RAO-2017]
MDLETLSPEIQMLLLKALACPIDLLQTLDNEAPSPQQFAQSPQDVLPTVLAKAILPWARQHALAIFRIPRDAHGAPNIKLLGLFLDEYLTTYSYEFPKDTGTLFPLCLLHLRISYFVSDYIDSAQKKLAPHFKKTGPEVEEITCVHEYYKTIVARCIDELEDDFIKAVFATDGVHRETQTSTKQISIFGGGGMMDFHGLDDIGLGLFSECGALNSSLFISHLVSLGSEFVYILATSNPAYRRRLIRAHSPVARHFLAEALEQGHSNHPEIPMSEQMKYDSDGHANRGYYLYKLSKGEDYLPMDRTPRASCPLRERAYVFWASGRFEHLGIGGEFLRSKNKSLVTRKGPLLTGGYLSVERRLEGVSIPTGQMLRLAAEFGSDI